MTRILKVGEEPEALASSSRAKSPKGKTDPTGKPKRQRATADRFATLNAFVDCSLIGLTRTEVLTWLVLYRDTRNGVVKTSAGDVARRIGASRRSVTTALGKLRQRGLLTLIRRGGLNQGPSVYRVEPLAKPP